MPLSSMLPHIKITDLLMEVDRWTGFTRHFTHLKTNEPVKDPALLLTAILADATNLGLGKMAESLPPAQAPRSSPGWSLGTFATRPTQKLWPKLSIVSIAFRSLRTGAKALLPLRIWSALPRGLAAAKRSGQVNAKYGNDPGVTFYTHISDQYAPFHTKVINATVRDATHVLDGSALSRVRAADRGALHRYCWLHRSRLRPLSPARLPLRASHTRPGGQASLCAGGSLHSGQHSIP